MKILVKMAYRNILRNQRRTVLAALTLAVGTAFLVISACFISGFHNKWIEGVARFFLGHIQIFQKGYYTHYYSVQLDKTMKSGEQVRELVKIEGVEGVGLRLETVGFATAGGKFHTTRILGIEPEEEYKISLFGKKLLYGRYLSPQPTEKHQILVGEDFAESLDLGVGDRLLVMLQSFTGDAVYEVFYVQGIFRTGQPDVDNFVTVVHLDVLQELMAQEVGYFADRVSSVVLSVQPARKTPQIARKIRQRVDTQQYDVMTWEEMAPDLKALLQMNQAVWSIFILILLVVCVMSTTNVMLMSVMERVREFGLLTSLGMDQKTLMTMVFLEALFIGLAGGIVGFAAGIAVSAYYARVGLDLSLFQKGLVWMMGEDTRVFFEFPLPLLVGVFFLIQGVAVVSALYPALKASRVNPIEALRFA